MNNCQYRINFRQCYWEKTKLHVECFYKSKIGHYITGIIIIFTIVNIYHIIYKLKMWPRLELPVLWRIMIDLFLNSLDNDWMHYIKIIHWIWVEDTWGSFIKPLIWTISPGNSYRNGPSHWINKRVIPLTASG